jgi:hypothetical protein
MRIPDRQHKIHSAPCMSLGHSTPNHRLSKAVARVFRRSPQRPFCQKALMSVAALAPGCGGGQGTQWQDRSCGATRSCKAACVLMLGPHIFMSPEIECHLIFGGSCGRLRRLRANQAVQPAAKAQPGYGSAGVAQEFRTHPAGRRPDTPVDSVIVRVVGTELESPHSLVTRWLVPRVDSEAEVKAPMRCGQDGRRESDPQPVPIHLQQLPAANGANRK